MTISVLIETIHHIGAAPGAGSLAGAALDQPDGIVRDVVFPGRLEQEVLHQPGRP